MDGRTLALDGLSVTYPGGVVAVHPTDLEVGAGEFFSLLGPSGCGKTTILKAVSGFVEPSAGGVSIGGRPMAGIAPRDRPTALIFQNLALFPLMSVAENVAFGLEARGVPVRRRRARAEELLALVDLEGQGGRRPDALSGGQRQRVAIARALAVEPAVLLLDEPLSALDLKLRQRMRGELKAIQRRTGVTFVYITHDQGEALTMSDRIAVMRAGRIEQVGTAEDVYARPASAFVATFVGEQNRLAGRVVAASGEAAILDTVAGELAGANPDRLRPGEAAELLVRPERVGLVGRGRRDGGRDDEGDGHDGAGRTNELSGTLERQDLEGPFLNLFLRVGDGEAAGGRTDGRAAEPFAVHVTNDGTLPTLAPGERLKVGFRARDAIAMRAAPAA